mmetsp:Transcript_11784/g.23937  ORF Transcript_11784/g.23937 Transcript_11784/m.23937 type:complete len:378 (+) Transcript_11784:89-1222(+)
MVGLVSSQHSPPSKFISLNRQIIVAVIFCVFAIANVRKQNFLSNLEAYEEGIVFSNHVGYFNLSCPFEMAKFSCAFLERSDADRARTTTSRDYYFENLNVVHRAFWKAFGSKNHLRKKRIFMIGDSLTRQLFIALVCNAFELHNAILDHVVVPWKDSWPCVSGHACTIRGGNHSGFDAASAIFRGGTELHFVPHHGWRDRNTSEEHALERLSEEIRNTGMVTFGKKTALPPGGPVDVLAYNVGVHFDGQNFRDEVDFFANKVGFPLMNNELNNTHSRPQIIYTTTPTQHFHTPNGVFNKEIVKKGGFWNCMDRVESNPRADVEKDILAPGVNVDVLLDSDDLNKGIMHVGKSDCSHYCMPGALDIVAARILDAITAI